MSIIILHNYFYLHKKVYKIKVPELIIYEAQMSFIIFLHNQNKFLNITILSKVFFGSFLLADFKNKIFFQ